MLATIRDAVLGKPPPTLREIKRENKRMARRAARDIDRQMVDIERRENDLMKSMKIACKKGDHKTSKALSLDVVRLRRTKSKVAGARSAQMSLESTMNNSINGAAIAESMKEGVTSMQKMSSGMNPMQVRRMGASFASEMDKMQLVDEVMDDAIAAQMGDCSEDEDEEAAELVNEVLHGIAIDRHIPLAVAPTNMGMPASHLVQEDSPAAQAAGKGNPGSGGDGGGSTNSDNLDLEERLRRLMDHE